MPRPSSLNATRRAHELEALAGGAAVDVLVIGGGVTGTGIALDAATRGLSVALVERRDLANGTSRWSSKLVHGGLRYLASGDLGIAYESAVERHRLMQATAPHLTRPLAMVLPVGGVVSTRRALLTGAGVAVGDLLRVAAGTPAATLPRPRYVPVAEAAALVPALQPTGLRGALLSWDGQLTGDARLVVALARTAAAHGARILTYCEALDADGSGARVRDTLSDDHFELRARHVIAAAGVWAEELEPSLHLRPSKGTHLVLDGAAVGSPRAALTVPVPSSGNRWVFLLPQPDGRVYLGLTDTPADTVSDDPTPAPGAEEFLLTTANAALRRELTHDDVRGTFTGLRPLVADAGHTADLSRRHAVTEAADGLVSVVGGKLTTYRRMAEDAVDRICARPDVAAGPCVTARTPLVGAIPRRLRGAVPAPDHLVGRYGGEAPELWRLATERGLDDRLVAHLPYLRVELEWAVRHELALTAEDLLDRRTRIGLVPEDRAAAKPAAAAVIEDRTA